MGDILVCGSAITDMFLDLESGSVKMEAGGVEHDLIFFTCGSKVQINSLKTRAGGGGVNTSVDLSRLGNNVSLAAKFGKDHNSEKIITQLKKESVHILPTRVSKVDGGFSIILRSKDNDRTILTYKGANNELGWDEVGSRTIDKFKWIYLASMTGKSFATVKKIAKYAYEQDKLIAFNPSSYVAKLGASALRPITRTTKVLIMNMEEAQLLLGLPPNSAQLPDEDVDSILKRIWSMGPKIVAITNGSEKAYVYDGEKRYSSPPYPCEVVETAGAGDAFNSGLLSGLMNDYDVERSFSLALASAHSVVGSSDTWVGLRNLKACERIVSRFEAKGHNIERKKLAPPR